MSYGNINVGCIDQHVTVDIELKSGIRDTPFFKLEADEFCQQLKGSNGSLAS